MIQAEHRPGGISIVSLSRPGNLRAELAADVRAGLGDDVKSLPPKYFYDARGSELFERITELPEYYLTRTEAALLEAHADELLSAGPIELMEIGSGSSRKTQLLIEALGRHGGRRYAGIDVSESALRGAAERLVELFPWLEVTGYVGDFETSLADVPRTESRLVSFLGSTIGNLEGPRRHAFFQTLSSTLVDGDRFLMGVDLVKDASILEAAYDDSAGVTAEFNRNAIHVLNHELDGDLPAEALRHVALYNREQQRIEMYLEATRTIDARFDALDMLVHFDEGERMLTEISCKFERAGVESDLARAGLAIERWLSDADQAFALVLASPAR